MNYKPWEPSVAQVTRSYSSRLPALDLKLRSIFPYTSRVDLINLKSQKQAMNISVVLPNSPNQNLIKYVLGCFVFSRLQ